MRRNDRLLRAFVRGSLAALMVALAGSEAQAQISVTFPARVVAAPDYATDVLGDAWDMCNAADISPFPQELVGFSSASFSSSPCRWNGTINAADASVVFLYPGIYGIVNPGQNGRNFPIDPSKYQVLSYKLNTNANPGETQELYWFHNSYQDPSAPAVNGYGRRFAPSTTIVGTQIVRADLTQSLLDGVPWSSGLVRGLRIDPNSTKTGQTVSFRWVRLTPASGAVQPISWTGGTATITVRDNSDNTDLTIASNVSSPYNWNYGFLPPGSYTLTVSNGSSSGTRTFTINNPPTIKVTDPSPTTGEDFATTVLGNPWDMSDSADLKITGSEHTTAVSFSGGQATATNTTDDPNVTLNRTVAIDTSKYRYLTYRFSVDAPFSLEAGTVARVLWSNQGSISSTNGTTSKDILFWPGMNSYTVDLASLSTAADGGLVNSSGALAWTASQKLSLRFDPHEIAAPRAFHIDDVKLTAKPAAAGSFTIRFVGSDADGDPTTVSLYYDNDTNAANGKTLIASGIPVSAGLFGWNTNGKPQGDYYIYAEATDGIQATGRYSTVPIQVTATTSPVRRADFDNDGKTDMTVYRPSNGTWYVLQSSSNFATMITRQWGLSGDKPVPGEYDGDGETDMAVYRPSNGTWYVLQSSTNSTTMVSRQWGFAEDTPVPGDYDGDRKTDMAVYRPSNGTWYILQSSTNSTTMVSLQWGNGGDLSAPGDYDGDGKTDMTVFRPSNGTWYILQSSTNSTTMITFQLGINGDMPVPGDYDGDGKTDVAVFRPSNATWYMKLSTNPTATLTRQWGNGGDGPVPGDYDGDGKTDMAVNRPSNGTWYILQSSTNSTSMISRQWGLGGDLPVILK